MKKVVHVVLFAVMAVFSTAVFAENEDPCAMPTTLTEKDGVYEIGTCGDLYKFAEMVNNVEFDDNIKGKLTDDICVNACGEGESVLNADGTLNGDGGSFKQWTPMNFRPEYDMLDVQVTLDGNGKTISGLYFDDISTENVGLFGVVAGMVFVSDLGIEDSYFRGEGYVGGLVGLNTGVGTFSITNSYNAGTVIGSDYVGGLVGYSSGTLTITNSYNAGSMNGDGDNVGGLVGYIFYSAWTITNSFFLVAEGVSGEFGGTPKSANEFHIGLVALMLHNYVQTGCGNDCIDGTIWGQNLKNGDLRPNFSSVINVETQELVLHTFEDDTRVYPTEYIAGQELPTGLTREGFVFLGWSSKEVAESSDDIVTSIASDATGKKEFYAQWKEFDGEGCFAIASTVELYAFANVVGSATDGKQICGTLAENIVVNTCDDGESVLKGDGSLNCSGEKFKQWTPMNVQSGVQVTFNGNGKTISGLYFDNGNKENVGLFGGVYGTVDISNLNIVDSYFKGKNGVGGLVGYSSGENAKLSIANSYNAGSVSGTDNVGGLVGCGKSDTLSITSSYNAGTVAGRYDVGGLVGFNDGGTLTVTNSYNVGAVSGSNVGGLVGANEYFSALTITNSYNAGSMSGSNVGGLLGANEYYSTLTIAHSFFLATGQSGDGLGGELKALDDFHDGTVAALLRYYVQTDCEENCIDGSVWGQDLTNANSLPDFSGEFAGGTLHALTLYTFDEDVRKYPTEYMKELGLELPADLVREGYIFAGWSTKEHAESVTDMVSSIAKGATGAKTFYAQWMKVSEEGVYEIATAVDLYKFAQLVNGGATNIKGKLTADICVNACGEGESVLKADGTLNGDGSEFTPWTPIGTETQKFNGTFDGAGHTISGLYFNQDASYAGLFGRSTKGGSIKNVGVVDSYIKGKNNVGGIVGYNGNCTVSNVFSTSTVEGGENVGGIAGYNEAGTIVNAYNMGAIKGKSWVGGIAGYNQGTTSHINNVYSSGTVSGTTYVRGLVGYNNESKKNINYAFYNTDVFDGDALTDKKGRTYYNDGDTIVIGKSTAELASTTLPEGFSSEIWLAGSKDVVDGKLVYKFPGLKIFNSQPEVVLFIVQKGSDGKDYCEIANADDLFKFAQLVNGGATGLNAKLTADICVNGCGEGEKSLLEQVAELEEKDELSPESFQQWTPMSVPKNVTVAFDGNGHTISGLYFNKEKSSHIGLFGQVVGDVSVSNLGVVDFYVNGNGEVGSLAGQVTGKLNIKNCYSAGSVKGVHYVGGIVGVNRDGAKLKIENSYNESSVNAPSGIVGGLVGENYNYASLTITNSYNAGAVSETQYVGGLVGDNYSAILTIENSYNVGAVSGNDYVGGLVGVNEDGTLKVLNSFFLATGGDGDALGGTQKSADEFHDGTVAFLLHDWCEKEDGSEDCKEGGLNGSVWGQVAAPREDGSVDTWPVLVLDGSGKLVFSIAAELNDGSTKDAFATKYEYGTNYVLPIPERTNYTFGGWFTDATFTEGSGITEIVSTDFGPKNVYAKWIPVKYTVKVAVNNSAMGVVEGLENSGVYDYGSEVTLRAVAKTGYEFSDWADDVKASAERTIVVTGNITYTANFKEIPASSSSSDAKSSSSEAKSSSSQKESIIAQAQLPQFSVTASGKMVSIAGARPNSVVDVFDMQGHRVKSVVATSADFTFALPSAGVYVIKNGYTAKRVNVR